MGTNDFDIYNFLKGFAANAETKEEITEKYIKGIINKEEFIKRMNNAK